MKYTFPICQNTFSTEFDVGDRKSFGGIKKTPNIQNRLKRDSISRKLLIGYQFKINDSALFILLTEKKNSSL